VATITNSCEQVVDDQSPTRRGVDATGQFDHYHFNPSALSVGDDITQTFGSNTQAVSSLVDN